MVISEFPHNSADTKKRHLNSRVVPLNHTKQTFSLPHLNFAATLLVIFIFSSPADDQPYFWLSDSLHLCGVFFGNKSSSKEIQHIHYEVHYAMYIKIWLKRRAQVNHLKSYVLQTFTVKIMPRQEKVYKVH